jgi:hypothetical protein
MSDTTVVPKHVAVGTQILRRAEVAGVIKKLLAKAHEEAASLEEGGNPVHHRMIRRKIAAYFEVMKEINELPVFVNAEVAEAAPAKVAGPVVDILNKHWDEEPEKP